MSGQVPEAAPDSPDSRFRLRGDEDGGVALLCALCDGDKGAHVKHWPLGIAPGQADLAAKAHEIAVHFDEPAMITCSVDYPVTRDQALGWAQQANWLLAGYYKYSFIFEAYCTVAYPDDPEAHEAEARAIVSGPPEDFYRFQVKPNETLTWDELCYVSTPDLVISENGAELIRIDGDND